MCYMHVLIQLCILRVMSDLCYVYLTISVLSAETKILARYKVSTGSHIRSVQFPSPAHTNQSLCGSF